MLNQTDLLESPRTMPTYCAFIPSPVGELQLVADDVGLVAILWDTDETSRVPLVVDQAQARHATLEQAEHELGEYFAGSRKVFTVPFAPRGTPFQQAVWSALQEIPFGETRSYAQIADRVGNRQGVRAVGGAIGRNPLSIMIPCHRVIGSNGKLTGFAGGLNRKSFLLDLESKQRLLDVA